MAAPINFVNLSDYRLPVVFKKKSLRLLRRIEKITRRKFTSLELVMVSPSGMRRLNKLYRRRDKITDVLSFQYQTGQALSGQIFICPQQAHSQAKAFGQSLLMELEFLFVHGSLHILGYNHVRAKDRKVMEDLEAAVLHKFK